MTAVIYALMACGSLQGPCWVLRGPFDTMAECRTQLEQVSQYVNEPVVKGVIKTDNDVYLCVKRPVNEWTPAQ